MIRTNLSTRPFYNERAVHIILLAAAIVVMAATAFNVSRVIRYSDSDTQLSTEASQNELHAGGLRASAARLRASIDSKRLESVSTEAREANELIDRRTFSWTELLNLFEATLPDNVRIASVRPKVDPKRGFILTVTVVARSVDDVDEMMQNLEATGAFSELLTPEEHVDEQGLLEATVEGRYQPMAEHPDTEGGKRP